MKTKNKILALVEIAIVLCSLFLVAIPAIAAEQNQEMQKVSASEVTTASKDDFVLGIYGNANEDNTIDMRDLTYVKLIFFGKKPETELADAKYDGKINPLDFIQIKLIIVGKEKELTFVDSADRIVAVKKPVKRIVVTYRHPLELLRSLNVPEDRIVGVESLIQSSGEPPYGVNYKVFFPEFQDVPTVGLVWTPDVEAILNLDPDVVFLIYYPWFASIISVDKAQDELESAGITVIRIYAAVGRGIFNKEAIGEVNKLGYVFDKRNEAEEFLDWYVSTMNTIKERVENMPEEDKPTVYLESTERYNTVFGEPYPSITTAGGKNIFKTKGEIDPEAVMERNPDIIVKVSSWGAGGYDVDAGDTEGLKNVREEIMRRPELQNVEAVKNGRVYVISGYIIPWGPAAGARGFILPIYMAKWFHPELFTDLDPKGIHQEYLTRFQGLDIDLDKKGVFVYPPFED
jgi:iron complex transport system substrate-binding protein